MSIQVTAINTTSSHPEAKAVFSRTTFITRLQMSTLAILSPVDGGSECESLMLADPVPAGE
jgi:hypothetical protein